MNKFVVEFFGTLLLLFSMVVAYSSFDPPNSIIFVSIAYMLLIIVGTDYSGAHYNPAITIAVLLRGKINIENAFFYFILQSLGGLVGAYLGSFLVENMSASNMPIATIELNFLKSMGAELLGAFLLAFAMIQSRTISNPLNKYYYGMIMGLTLGLSIYFLSQYSGGSFNPAVGLGVCAVGIAYWSDIWIFIISTIAAGALAPFLYLLFNKDT